MAAYEGNYDAHGRRFGIVVSRFNEFITKRLLDAATGEFMRHGADSNHIDTVWVPGAFEVPLACRKFAETGKVEVVIALACVIRGETPHFEYVAAELSRGVAAVALECSVPVIYGAITADTLEQAIQRAGGKLGNKGAEAARNAMEIANLYRSLGAQHPEVIERMKALNTHA